MTDPERKVMHSTIWNEFSVYTNPYVVNGDEHEAELTKLPKQAIEQADEEHVNDNAVPTNDFRDGQ